MPTDAEFGISKYRDAWELKVAGPRVERGVTRRALFRKFLLYACSCPPQPTPPTAACAPWSFLYAFWIWIIYGCGDGFGASRRGTAASTGHESSAKFSYCMKKRREFAALGISRAFRAVFENVYVLPEFIDEYLEFMRGGGDDSWIAMKYALLN